MLVLSRKVNEVICIGDSIRVTVVEIGQGRVKIGIVAPRNISVDRLEVRDRTEREQKEPHARGE